MDEAHSRAELKIGDLRVEELLGERTFRTRRQPERGPGVMAEHHGGALKGVLKDEILFTTQMACTLEQSEGDRGRGKALEDSALSPPVPQIGIGSISR